jgi:hypothetical protein
LPQNIKNFQEVLEFLKKGYYEKIQKSKVMVNYLLWFHNISVNENENENEKTQSMS